MKRILGILLLIISASCSNPSTNDIDKRFGEKYEHIYSYPLSETDTLNIYQNKQYYDGYSEHFLMLEIKQREYTTSVSGGYLSEFAVFNDSIKVQDTIYPVVFSDNDTSYFVPTYVEGSTYGAVRYFIIYEENESWGWEICKLPFDRVEIEDIDNDQISEIVAYNYTYHINPDSCILERTIYSFQDGLLTFWGNERIK
jgi:hypothetical protein